MKQPPLAVFYSGANGAGKSTMRERQQDTYPDMLHLDPDAVAREIEPRNPRSVDIQAAKETLRRFRKVVASRKSYSLEPRFPELPSCTGSRKPGMPATGSNCTTLVCLTPSAILNGFASAPNADCTSLIQTWFVDATRKASKTCQRFSRSSTLHSSTTTGASPCTRMSCTQTVLFLSWISRCLNGSGPPWISMLPRHECTTHN